MYTGKSCSHDYFLPALHDAFVVSEGEKQNDIVSFVQRIGTTACESWLGFYWLCDIGHDLFPLWSSASSAVK